MSATACPFIRTFALASYLLLVGPSQAEGALEKSFDTQTTEKNVIEGVSGPELVSSFDKDVRDLEPLTVGATQRQKALPKKSVWRGMGPTASPEPDPDLAVGPNRVIQVIETGGNVAVQIRDKSTGSISTTFAMDTLGGGATWCGSDLPWYRSSPFAAYDRYADRWVVGHIGSYREPDEWNSWVCLYVSKTSNPVSGGWYSYRVDTTGLKMGFAPTFGVRRQAYVLSLYLLQTSSGDPAPSGHKNSIWVLNRKDLIAGVAGPMFRIPLNNFEFWRAPHRAGIFTHEGWRKELATTPILWYRTFDDEFHTSQPGNPNRDFLELGSITPDWEANSATTSQQRLNIFDFNSDLCIGSCLVQPWGSNLVHHIDRMPNGKISRPTPDTQFLVGAFPVYANGAAAVRWFELKSVNSGPWTFTQRGLMTSDENLTSPSIARDWRGNIAIVANKVGPTTFPSIVRRGHGHSDPPSTMGTRERFISRGADIHSSGFWSDTKSVLDPFDECSIWSTGVYTPNSDWATDISRIEFDDCQPLILSTGFEDGFAAWN